MQAPDSTLAHDTVMGIVLWIAVLCHCLESLS